MTKQKPKSWPNIPFKTWGYEEQTQMKHKVLSDYISQWLVILGSWNERINYIDGFGGIGAYHNDDDTNNHEYLSNNYGSPVFTLEAIRERERQGRIKEANVVIIDKDKKNLENIKTIMKHQKLEPNKKVFFVHGDFDEKVNEILDEAKNLAPTFFLVDPFGFSQIKMSTLSRIMEHSKSEILLNFMYNAIQRFIEIKDEKLKHSLEKHFNELFGCETWKEHIEKRTTKKEKALRNLFRDQCKKIAKFVYPYRLSFPDKNMPYYYLFHLSNHQKACVTMKSSFARHNKGNFEYKCREDSKPTLFDMIAKRERGDTCKNCFISNDKNETSCKECIKTTFDGKKNILYSKILDELIDVIPLTESEIKKALQDLEEEGKIKVIAGDGRKRRKGFIAEDLITFL